MKLLIDMNLSPLWEKIMTESGWEAAHWSRLGPVDAMDEEIMAYARDNGYAVFTHDLDFGAILAASGSETPSVVQIRGDDVIPNGMTGKVVRAVMKHLFMSSNINKCYFDRPQFRSNSKSCEKLQWDTMKSIEFFIVSLMQAEPDLEKGALLTIDPVQARLRLLPFFPR
jgi:predicted nuclease of predicted toxin-antitoxin system